MSIRPSPVPFSSIRRRCYTYCYTTTEAAAKPPADGGRIGKDKSILFRLVMADWNG